VGDIVVVGDIGHWVVVVGCNPDSWFPLLGVVDECIHSVFQAVGMVVLVHVGLGLVDTRGYFEDLCLLEAETVDLEDKVDHQIVLNKDWDEILEVEY